MSHPNSIWLRGGTTGKTYEVRRDRTLPFDALLLGRAPRITDRKMEDLMAQVPLAERLGRVRAGG